MTVWSASPSRQAWRRDRRRLFCRSLPGRSETPSSTDSLGLHIVMILEHPAPPPLLAGTIRQGSFFLRRCGGADVLVLWVSGRGSVMRPRKCRSLRPALSHSARRLPEPAGNLDRVDSGLPPPRTLV